MGRTGRWFAHQHWDVKPDVVTLAKALAGGVAMGGLMAKPEVAEKLKPGTHAATFGGNPLAARAALATIETIEQDGLLERAGQIGERFRDRFLALKEKCPLIPDVRVKGAMIGVQLAVEGAPFVQACLQKGLLVNCTHQTVLRLLPALTIADEQIDEGCDILDEVLLSTDQVPVSDASQKRTSRAERFCGCVANRSRSLFNAPTDDAPLPQPDRPDRRRAEPPARRGGAAQGRRTPAASRRGRSPAGSSGWCSRSRRCGRG